MSGSAGDLDRVCIRLGRLQITVEQFTAADLAPEAGSEASFEVVDYPEPEVPLAGEGAPSQEEPGLPPRSSAEDFLAADTPAAFEALHLGDLAHLSLDLSDSGSWSGKARVARAYRAGLSAAAVLRGDRGAPVTSPKLEFKNQYYLCLRSAAYPQGFVAQTYHQFLRGCPKDRHGRLESGSVSHAFASKSEAFAFLAGAGRSWPQAL